MFNPLPRRSLMAKKSLITLAVLFVLTLSQTIFAAGQSPDEEKFCTTWEDYVQNQLDKHGALYHDCYNGTCDDPNVRDSWIPSPEDPMITIRLYFNIFCDDNGNDCAAT